MEVLYALSLLIGQAELRQNEGFRAGIGRDSRLSNAEDAAFARGQAVVGCGWLRSFRCVTGVCVKRLYLERIVQSSFAASACATICSAKRREGWRQTLLSISDWSWLNLSKFSHRQLSLLRKLNRLISQVRCAGNDSARRICVKDVRSVVSFA